VLAKLFSSYIAIRYYLKPFKDSIIVVFLKTVEAILYDSKGLPANYAT
jgi:hypothetical protein